MYISNDLLFVNNGNKTIIYNYFINKVVMVGNKTGCYIENNIGKEVDESTVKKKNAIILKKNGIFIDSDDEYLKEKFQIKNSDKEIETVYFHLTQRCNLQCTYCYNKDNLNKRDELDTKTIFKILEELYEIGVKTINITGGEALLREDILEIVKKSKELGFQICLLTNGTLIYKKTEIFEYIDKCIISLDSIDDEENEITRKGSKRYKILQSIQKLPEEYKRKIKIRSVIVRGKEDTIDKNREYLNNIGVDYIATMCLPNNSQEISNVPEFVSEFISGGKSSMCGAGRNIIAIDSNGDIYPCQSFVNREYCLGNVLEENWHFIFKEKAQKCNLTKLSVDEKVKCKSCEYKFLCLGGCPNISYRVYGDILKENDFLCIIQRKCKKIPNIAF